jgi:hypothetical protein
MARMKRTKINAIGAVAVKVAKKQVTTNSGAYAYPLVRLTGDDR